MRLVIPSRKHMASRMLDLPEPFRPVMALNSRSKPWAVEERKEGS